MQSQHRIEHVALRPMEMKPIGVSSSIVGQALYLEVRGNKPIQLLLRYFVGRAHYHKPFAVGLDHCLEAHNYGLDPQLTFAKTRLWQCG
ncbi:hypothetical protein M5689_011686 [Euphorbia peplus]|nr:hypothetical protein M5689_011686 [Euphorbia peplus]